ncbi:hypothetical protein [Mycolicibacterium phlei]|uniref:hypothetical protein n=1 Tax=Mycolicibacterium phlei TaxID=1771 RepID=UPI00025ADD0C|nr:hypothetical protein [Mycolicibacterium phlei]EID18211.1 FAD-dependent pyridine nucleotide-disulfide oxidoreductase [Mycolicibacterium phlei RIVM601174]MBF4191275.1 FAD-dependent pyridine nucleotide-disulfide oxidoreductase [Mycolicibacterium phlei]
MARWWHSGHREWLRVEHWTNATQQAQGVAHNIAHPEQPREYRPVEYVWSDQYGVKLQLTGRFSNIETFDVIGGLDWVAPRPRAAIVGADIDGNLVACATVNWPLRAMGPAAAVR